MRPGMSLSLTHGSPHSLFMTSCEKRWRKVATHEAVTKQYEPNKQTRNKRNDAQGPSNGSQALTKPLTSWLTPGI